MRRTVCYPALLFILASCMLLACGQTVTVFKSRHPTDRKIHDAWVKYNKETINPHCRDDYIRGSIMGLHSEPLEDVRISAGGMETHSDEAGKFYLIIPDGMNLKRMVRIQLPGYRNIELLLDKITCREVIVRMQEAVRQPEPIDENTPGRD
jgi:hypothetical protein